MPTETVMEYEVDVYEKRPFRRSGQRNTIVRCFNILVLDLVPSFARTRNKILSERVQRLSEQAYEDIHIGDDSDMEERPEDFGGDILIRQREAKGEDNDGMGNEEVAALQNIHFAG